MGFTDPFKRLKWGIFPVRRVVDEEPEHSALKNDSEDSAVSSALEFNYENQAATEVAEIRHPEEFEYRDEANRSWWRFFDEYEYRVPRNKKQEEKWYHWFHPDDTKEERILITKLDIILTLYSMMAYWVKYLDQTNLNNAYVASMKEDLHMGGNDLIHTQVMFNIGNIIFQIPFVYVLNSLPLNYILPGLDIIWSALTMATAGVHNVQGLKAIRFFIGACESGNYLAYQYLFGTFYTHNIAIRSMCYYLGQYLGLLTSGLLSGAIVRAFKSQNGLAAWRWIFIIDGIISIVVGIIGVYALPGTPNDCYSIFLTDDEIRLLRRRLKKNHTAATNPKKEISYFVDWNLWKSILTSWEIYVLSLWNIFCWNNNNGSSGAYLLWLKSLKLINPTTGKTEPRYSAGKLQDVSSLTPGLGLVWLIITNLFADLFKCRWGAIVFSQVFNVLGNILLAVWKIPERAKWFAFCMQYFGWAMAPVLYSWQNDICRRDARKRAVILVVMNILAQTFMTWISVLVWKTVEQPRYLKGFTFTACAGFSLALWTFVVLYFYKKQERKYAKQNGIILYNSKTDPEFLSRLEKEQQQDAIYQDKKLDPDYTHVDEKKIIEN